MRIDLATGVRTVALAAFCVLLSGADAGARRITSGSAIRMTATAYCQRGKTASGIPAQTGLAAADPRLLPIGSVIRIEPGQPQSGTYTIADTGAALKGHKLDIFVSSCRAARLFGRRQLQVRIVQLPFDVDRRAAK